MTLDLFRLDGRVALVTGGDKGLGQAMAVALAQAGADVAIVSRSGENAATLEQIAAAGRRGLGLTFDLALPESAARIVAQTTEQLGRLDILINNAGTIRRAAAAETTLEDFSAVLDVNLNGLWDYAIRPKTEPAPATFDGRILVPFPIESALSGVMKTVGDTSSSTDAAYSHWRLRPAPQAQ